MTGQELKRFKQLTTILTGILLSIFVAVVYLILTDQKYFIFFFKAEPSPLWRLILTQRNFEGLKNFEIFITFYLLLIFFLGGWYFKKRRLYNIEHHIEKIPTNSTLNENSIIKCGSTSKYLFFNCNYKGKPTIKMPEYARQRDPAYGSNIMKTSEEDWKKYKSAKHFYCPECGKEMYNKNLIENFKPTKQIEIFKYFAYFTLLLLFANVFIIEEFMRLQQNAYFSINVVFIALAGFLLSLIITLISKK